ncbi:TonB-dependent receptor [Puniceicoccaceae bacterium K14]|nr:TonB-dependent receptor [Puniceicoccaceae bacterium K14]
MKTIKLKLIQIGLASISTVGFLHAQMEPHELEDLVTTATRNEKPITSLSVPASVISSGEIEAQLSLSDDPITLLESMVPSFAPSRQKLTGWGESFRGRSPLYMVDGIPQSNPLRPGSRDGHTIDLAAVERVEVIYGSSAIQGMGATGGIINYITKKPSEIGTIQSTSLQFTTSDSLDSETHGYKANYFVSTRLENADYTASITYQDRGMTRDGNGDSIGFDGSQGDTQGASSYNVLLKGGFDFKGEQRLQAQVNLFQLDGLNDWGKVNGDVANGVTTKAVRVDPLGDPLVNDVKSFNVVYTNGDFLGGSLTAQLFRQQFAARYGAGTYFNDPLLGNEYDQTQNESEKNGARITFVKDFVESDASIVTGIDLIDDTTQQVLLTTGRKWVPETSYEALSPYFQVEKGFGDLTLNAGLRGEFATLTVDDYTTISRADVIGVDVGGGTPSSDEILFNIGGTYDINESFNLYGGFTQGYGMADVGRILRGIYTPGIDIDSFFDLEPVVTDNFELGMRYRDEVQAFTFTVYQSESDLGSRLEADSEGVWRVKRERTEIHGFEATYDRNFEDNWKVGGIASYTYGESDTDQDGKVDTELSGINIAPPKLVSYVSKDWESGYNARLQARTLFDRDTVNEDFQGYTLLDLSLSLKTENGSLRLGIENLLDKQYITYYSQNNPYDDRYYAGRGRTLTLGYTHNF